MRRYWPILLALAVGVALSYGLSRLGSDGETASSDVMPAAGDGPARVILFAPNLTESAWALGHGDKVVGITDYCVWPEELLDRPRVGGMIDPNLETIVALSPDLLVLQGRSATLREMARAHGIAVAEVHMDTDLESVLAGLARLDSLLSGGRPTAAPARIAEIRRELGAVRERGRELFGAHPPEVLPVLGHDAASLANLYTTGRGTFLNELIELAGGRPQHGDHPRSYFLLSLESLVADPPDVALELRPGATDSEAEREELVRVWRAAGLDRTRVESIAWDGILIPGPRIAEAARVVQRALVAGSAP